MGTLGLMLATRDPEAYKRLLRNSLEQAREDRDNADSEVERRYYERRVRRIQQDLDTHMARMRGDVRPSSITDDERRQAENRVKATMAPRSRSRRTR